MSLWEFRSICRTKKREIKKGSVGGWEGKGGRSTGVQGERAKRRRGWVKDKNFIPTHGLWLCASESTCSLSKGQSWSCLPETGGKGGDGGTAPQQVGGWEPKHTAGGDASVCTGVGGSVVVATGAAWVWGWGTEPHKAKTCWCFRDTGRGRSDQGVGAQWMA